ncbi:MAG: hypothetical protein U1E15_00160 [Hyphomicrobiales bacterium]
MSAVLLRYLQLAAAYGLSALFSGTAIAAVLSVMPAADFPLPFVPLAGFCSIVIAIWAALPAHAFIALMEWQAIRTPYAYCAFASLAGLAFSFILKVPGWVPLAGILIGLATGLLFWVIAGRTAGTLKGKGFASHQLLGLLGLSALVTAGAIALYAF